MFYSLSELYNELHFMIEICLLVEHALSVFFIQKGNLNFTN